MPLSVNKNDNEENRFRDSTGAGSGGVCVAVCNDDGTPQIHFLENNTWIENEVSTSNFFSPVLDVRKWRSGNINISWNGYDGLTGATNIQTSFNGTDDWSNWGGLSGAVIGINADSNQAFEMTHIAAPYIRLAFYIGDGSTVTINAQYTLKVG